MGHVPSLILQDETMRETGVARKDKTAHCCSVFGGVYKWTCFSVGVVRSTSGKEAKRPRDPCC